MSNWRHHMDVLTNYIAKYGDDETRNSIYQLNKHMELLDSKQEEIPSYSASYELPPYTNGIILWYTGWINRIDTLGLQISEKGRREVIYKNGEMVPIEKPPEVPERKLDLRRPHKLRYKE